MVSSKICSHLRALGQAALAGLTSVVSDAINSELLQPFTLEDIKGVVHELSGLKAAGPDGFHDMLYQRCWDTMNCLMAGVVSEFSGQGSFPQVLNSTNLALIPNVPNSEQISQFRLISLCNFSL